MRGAHELLKKWHRALGLGLALFWLMQVLSGVAIELIWWLDGALYREADAGIHTPVLQRSLDAVQAQGATVSSMWSAGTVVSQMKIYYRDRAGEERVRRVDAAGATLYDVQTDSLLNLEGLAETLSGLHGSLLLGPFGRWLVAVSGVCLVLSLSLGLRLALHGRVRLRDVLAWRPVRSTAVRAFQTHRMAGAWVVIPALALASTGSVLALAASLRSVQTAAAGVAGEGAGTAASALEVATHAGPAPVIGPARAMDLALDRLPGSRLSALTLPDATHAWYELRVRAPDETERFWGTTRIRVSIDGKVKLVRRGDQPALERAREALYPFHTGQFGGAWLRTTALLAGLLLLLTSVYGILLWDARRAGARSRS